MANKNVFFSSIFNTLGIFKHFLVLSCVVIYLFSGVPSSGCVCIERITSLAHSRISDAHELYGHSSCRRR